MIRPATAICLLVFVGSGMFLYQTKYRSKMLDIEIEETVKAAAKARSRVRELQTAYSELNDPGRLQVLAEQHLPRLKPAIPGQYTSLADLGRRLPAPGAMPVAEPPAPEPPATLPPPLAPAVTPPPPPTVPMATAKPVPVAAPAVVATAKPVPPPPGLRPTPLAPPRPVPVSTTPVSTMPVSTTPVSTAPVFTQMGATPAPPRSIPAEDLRRIANGAPVDTSQPAVASALGMARSLLVAPGVAPASAARPAGRP
jgi:hypothetical protein